jgi:hypothetical protein
VEHALQQDNVTMAMLYLTADVFMLRVPSELLPAVTGSPGGADGPLLEGAHCCIAVGASGEELVLRLARRKNRQQGSVLRRACMCSGKPTLCPVHVLGPWVSGHPPLSTPFAGVTAACAREDLKSRLFRKDIDHANFYWLHDLRRSHPQDMVDNGGRLCDILRAGEWTSPAFTSYLNLEAVETAGVVEAHMAESDDDEEAALTRLPHASE